MTFGSWGLVAVATFVGAVGCSSDIQIGQNLRKSPVSPFGGAGGISGGGAGGISGGGAGGAAAVSGSGGGGCQITSCQGKTYLCGNCLDDDGDGTVDSDDVYCTGPCDDSEDSFAIGIRSGQGPACKEDCFFDSDVGSGNDGCNFSHTCDPLSVAPDFPPSGDATCAYDETANIPGMTATCADMRLAQDPMCGTTCGPLVPNGCDCFGCCELPAGSGAYVWLGSESSGTAGCTLDTLDDPAVCHPCTPVPSCLNPCEACEICVGRTEMDPSCSSGVPACPAGMDSCGVADGPRCNSGDYCITGCCVPEPR